MDADIAGSMGRSRPVDAAFACYEETNSMMRRYVCIGDQPETGGYIEPFGSGRPFSIRGRPAANIGSLAFCNACKTAGPIAKAGGPRRHIHCGVALALEGDIVCCQCSEPPRLLADPNCTSWFEDSGAARGMWATAHDVTAAPSDIRFDEQAHLVSAFIAGMPFYIELAEGRTFSGKAEANGLLPRIDTGGESEYMVYWEDEALARTGGAQ